MEIKYNAKGVDRKTLVKAVSDIVGEPSKYLGAPTFAYSVTDWNTITRDGNLDIFDRADTEQVENLIEELAERGFVVEDTENETADMAELVIEGVEPGADDISGVDFSIGITMVKLSDKPFDEVTLEKFNAIVESKQKLFQKALSTENPLTVKFDVDTIWFNWFDAPIDNDHFEFYSVFIKKLYAFAENAARVTAKEKPIENEKFAMRTFLNRIGLSGKEYKPLRKELMKNLSGNSAYRYGKPE